MIRKNMFAGLTLVALLMTAVVLPVAGYAAQADQSKAEKFIDIAEKALEQSIKLRDKAQEKGVDVTAANALIAGGEALLNDARTALSNNDPQLAFEKAKEAQANFRDALKTFETPMTEEEEESEKGEGILVAISNSEERIQRIEDALTGITSTQENQVYIDWVNANITEAEQNLTDAKAVFETTPINVTKAAQLHADANKNIEEAFKALKMIGDWTVSWRMDNFFSGIKKDFERITNALDNAKVSVDELKTKLTGVEPLIQSAEEKLLSGDKQGALEDVKNARNIIQEVTKGLATLQHGEQGKGNGQP